MTLGCGVATLRGGPPWVPRGPRGPFSLTRHDWYPRVLNCCLPGQRRRQPINPISNVGGACTQPATDGNCRFGLPSPTHPRTRLPAHPTPQKHCGRDRGQGTPPRTARRTAHNGTPSLPNGYLAGSVPNPRRVGTYLPRYPGGWVPRQVRT